MDIAFNLLVRRWLTGQEVHGIKIFRLKGFEILEGYYSSSPHTPL